MLTQIQFSNYRAFARGEFRLRPITIFVGANSVGKTSLLQLPLILKQTASIAARTYKAALRIHGREVNIGDLKNFFYNQNTKENFELSIGFRSNALIEKLQSGYYNEFTDLFMSIMQWHAYVLANMAEQAHDAKEMRSASRFMDKLRPLSSKTPFSEKELEEALSFLSSASEKISQISSDKLPMMAFRHMPNSALSRRRMQRFDGTVNVKDLERTHRFLVGVMKVIENADLTYALKIGLADGESGAKHLRVNEFALMQKGNDILRIVLRDGSVQRISSSFCDEKFIDNYHGTLEKCLNPVSTIFGLFTDAREIERFQLPEYVRLIFSSTQEVVQECFDDTHLGHIGPLRAYPKRFYFLDTAQTGASDGDLLVETLRENDDLRQKVNKWLMRFGIDIRVRQLEEIIYRLAVRSKDHAFDLDITDVGFGISQVLPILVEGFTSSPGKTILIEQPEIHLHPKMQGELADLFIDIVNLGASEEERRCLIVETHSEYLLSRLRRRIAEGKIKHSDVALYFVEKMKAGGGSTVRGSYMPAHGGFEWPEEFFAEDLNDTLAYLKTAMRKRDEASAESTVKN